MISMLSNPRHLGFKLADLLPGDQIVDNQARLVDFVIQIDSDKIMRMSSSGHIYNMSFHDDDCYRNCRVIRNGEIIHDDR
jgi:hypothetical protein